MVQYSRLSSGALPLYGLFVRHRKRENLSYKRQRYDESLEIFLKLFKP